jgi:8-oxo-dGTP pyrophosphatase MutT (NUDIX family)
MDLKEIREKLASHRPVILGVTRYSAVVLPLYEDENEGLSIVFEQRAFSVTQPGDVCFPGGGVEDGETPRQAAAREFEEELALKEGEDFEMLCELGYQATFHGKCVYCFAAQLAPGALAKAAPQRSEVSEIFTIPVRWLTDNPPYIYHYRQTQGKEDPTAGGMLANAGKYDWTERTNSMPIWNYGQHCLWGLTARFVELFLEVIGK